MPFQSTRDDTGELRGLLDHLPEHLAVYAVEGVLRDDGREGDVALEEELVELRGIVRPAEGHGHLVPGPPLGEGLDQGVPDDLPGRSSPQFFSEEPSSTKRTGFLSEVGPWWVASMVISYPFRSSLRLLSARR